MNIALITHTAKTGGLPTWTESFLEGSKRNNKEIYCIKPSIVNILNDIKLIKNSDIIHQTHFSPLSNLYLAYAGIINKKVVVTIHGDYISAAKDYSKLRRTFSTIMIEYALRRADTITVPSEYLKKIISKKLPVNNIRVIYNPLFIGKLSKPSRQELRLSPKDVLITEITDFKYNKKAQGTIDLIDSVNKLPDNYKLFIIGGRGEYNSYKKKYSSNKIRFLGKLKRSKSLGILSMSDLAVHFSYLDNIPYFILESIALKIPVLANRVGAVDEILSGHINFASKSNLDRKIKEIVTDEKHRTSIINKQSKTLSKFEPKKIYKRFQVVYNLLYSEKNI